MDLTGEPREEKPGEWCNLRSASAVFDLGEASDADDHRAADDAGGARLTVDLTADVVTIDESCSDVPSCVCVR